MKILPACILLSTFVVIANGEPAATRRTSPAFLGITFMSAVNGVLFKCYVSGDKLNRSGGSFIRGDGWQEPKGRVSLMHASELAMKEAKRVLGDKIKSKDPTWHLNSASRKAKGGDSVYNYYYHFSFMPYQGTKDSRKRFQTQQLQVVVLLDGTVLPTKNRNSKQGRAGQPAIAP